MDPLEPRLLLTGAFLDGVVAGLVSADPIGEASGLAASQRNADVLWTHNDSGDEARIFALNTQGQLLGAFDLAGADAIDYEDIAVGPGPTRGLSYVYIADTGNNNAHAGAPRDLVQIYRVPEPAVEANGGDQSGVLANVDVLTLDYPGGEAHDAETLLVDPLSGDLLLVTKRDALNRVYRAPAPGPGHQSIALEFVGAMSWGDVTGGAGLTGAVGGDVSPDGLEVLIKVYAGIYLYDRPIGTPLWQALVGSVPFSNPPYTPEPQGEAIAFDADGTGFFTLSEARSASSVPLLYHGRAGMGDATTLTFQRGVSPEAGYDGVVDTEIRGANPDADLGGGPSINVDGDDGGHPAQGLLRFDALFGGEPGRIAPDRTIDSAALVLDVFNPGHAIELYAMGGHWDDSATWNQFGGNGIQADGVEALTPPVASTSAVGDGSLTIDVTTSLRQWQADPASNHGWLLQSTGTDGIDFNASEAAPAGARPRLVVTHRDAGDVAAQYRVNQAPRLQLGDAPLPGFAGGDTDRVTILWQTVPAGEGVDDAFVVQYRQAGDVLWRTVGPTSQSPTGVEGRIIHAQQITGLAYDADYEYRVHHRRAGNVVAAWQQTFRTRRPAGDDAPFTFVAYGDSAYTPTVANFRAVQGRINAIDPAFALLLGDNVYGTGTHQELDARFDPDLNPEAAAWTAGHIDYVGFGNHDVGAASGLASEQSFAVPIPSAGVNAPAAPPASERSEHNYAFDYGDVHFVTFDTNSLNNASRLAGLLAWVEADLAASAATWKIVYGHHPVAGTPDKPEVPSGNYFGQVVPRLRAAGADLFLVGHSHTYSWTFPLLGTSGGAAAFVADADGDYAQGAGLVQVVSGAGGRSLRSGDYAQFPFVAAGFTTTTDPPVEYGFTRIDVTPERLVVAYVAADDGAVIDRFMITAAPAVAEVRIAAAAWAPAFRDHLRHTGAGGDGFAVADGAAQTDPLPWIDLDQIAIRFTHDVQVEAGDLALHGARVSSYAFAPDGFTYDASTATATWALAAPMGTDALLLRLADTVHNAHGVALDGDWVDGGSAFPSGDGVSGGAFAFRFNVAPGDTNRDGVVSVLDIAAVRAAAGHTAGNAPYTALADLDGDAIVDGADARLLRERIGTSLPAGEPGTAVTVGATSLGAGLTDPHDLRQRNVERRTRVIAWLERRTRARNMRRSVTSEAVKEWGQAPGNTALLEL